MESLDVFEPLGTGIYLSASYFDHSCQPNARVVFDGTKAHVIATKDIHTLEKVDNNQISTLGTNDLSSMVKHLMEL